MLLRSLRPANVCKNSDDKAQAFSVAYRQCRKYVLKKMAYVRIMTLDVPTPAVRKKKKNAETKMIQPRELTAGAFVSLLTRRERSRKLTHLTHSLTHRT